MIALGSIVKDSVTGLTGVAVCRSEWLWGCVRIGVQPQGFKDGKPYDEVWFDEARLVSAREDSLSTGGPAREGQRNTVEG
jgi:hypothetical protein